MKSTKLWMYLIIYFICNCCLFLTLLIHHSKCGRWVSVKASVCFKGSACWIVSQCVKPPFDGVQKGGRVWTSLVRPHFSCFTPLPSPLFVCKTESNAMNASEERLFKSVCPFVWFITSGLSLWQKGVLPQLWVWPFWTVNTFTFRCVRTTCCTK